MLVVGVGDRADAAGLGVDPIGVRKTVSSLTIRAPGAQWWIIVASSPWLMMPGTIAPGRPSLRATSWSVKRGKFILALPQNCCTRSIDTSGEILGQVVAELDVLVAHCHPSGRQSLAGA